MIRERKLLDAIPEIHPYAVMIKGAQLAILACADPAQEKYQGNWPLDLSAAVENLLLAAHIKGLGAVWCGIFPEEDRIKGLRALLNIPASIVPFALIPLGYPAEEKIAAERFNARRIYRNQWGVT